VRPLTPLFHVIALCALLCTTYAPLSQAAEKGVLLTESVQLKVADAFLEEGEYYRAVTEYKRFLILFPDSERADYAHFKTGLACYQGEEFETAAKSFRYVHERFGDSAYAPQACYLEGLTYWKNRQFGAARNALETVVRAYPQSESAPLALIAAAMLALEQDYLTTSRRSLQTLAGSYPEHPVAPKTSQALKLLDQYETLPRKSEVLAGLMSALVPGSGYFYAEHYGDGITAFVINALAIAGIVTAAGQENYAVAGIVGGVGLPFYFGNIYGSANAAKKWNLAIRKELRNQLELVLSCDFW